MIIFFIFLFLWLGISFRYSLIVFSILSSILSIILFYKYKKAVGLICLSTLILGVGISYIKFDFKQESYAGLVIDSHDNYFLMLSKGERLYTYYKDNPYEIGDYLTIKGKKKEIDFAVLESGFDFNDYLEKKGVYYQLSYEDIQVQFLNPIRIREKRNKFLSHFSLEHQNLISALLFSDKNDDGAVGDINKLHLARLANASGIFIYAYLHFFSFILSYFIKNKKLKIVSLLTLVPYFIFTFPRLTIVRIFLMELFRYLNEAFLNKRFRSIQMYGIVGILLLLFDYHNGYQISFIIGFTLPVLISFIHDAIFDYKKIKKKALSLLLIYLLLIPFELKFYNGINPLSLIVQVLLTPLFIFLASISLLCFYGVPIYSVVNITSKGISNILGWLGKIAFQINAPPFQDWMILIYVLIFLVFCYYKSISFVPLYRFSLTFLLSTLVLYLMPVNNLISEEVCFINVGQGDSCLIRKGNTSILIDTGGSTYQDIAKEVLIPYLQKKRIYKLDMVITTHADLDHSGALNSLKENYYVKNVITEETSFPINVGGITFNNYNNHVAEYSDENDRSLVIGFHAANKDFLIMGDAPIEVEKNIIKEYEHIPCDVLKVGHHGSKTSSCDEFIKYINPNEAVVSCGKNNKYGHPHQTVINTLKKNNIKILRTDEIGTIVYYTFIST